MKQLALRYAAILVALMVILAIITPAGSALAEGHAWSEQVVLLNTSVDSIELSTGDTLRANVWETPGNGARWYQIGFCLDESCQFVRSALLVDERDGRVYAAGKEVPGVRFYITRDDKGTLLEGAVDVDNIHFAFQ